MFSLTFRHIFAHILFLFAARFGGKLTWAVAAAISISTPLQMDPDFPSRAFVSLWIMSFPAALPSSHSPSLDLIKVLNEFPASRHRSDRTWNWTIVSPCKAKICYTGWGFWSGHTISILLTCVLRVHFEFIWLPSWRNALLPHLQFVLRSPLFSLSIWVHILSGRYLLCILRHFFVPPPSSIPLAQIHGILRLGFSVSDFLGIWLAFTLWQKVNNLRKAFHMLPASECIPD